MWSAATSRASRGDRCGLPAFSAGCPLVVQQAYYNTVDELDTACYERSGLPACRAASRSTNERTAGEKPTARTRRVGLE
uniref:Uncharacterized protein n=1 Tax=Tanacetum cinerariifolium TaxID=118510 RepID=A0A699XHD6_TANCI|nr:hypothetical protein [Tanacetum cinerariifolium]